MNHTLWTSLMAVPAGAPPSPAMMDAPMVAPPPPAKETQWAPIMLALVGGIIGILGAVLPWIQAQLCTGVGLIQFCVPWPLPTVFAVGSYDGFLAVGNLLALLFALVGMVLVFLQKPMTGMIAGVMGLVTFAVALLWILRAGSVVTVMQLAVGAAYANVTVSIGFGVYVTVVGGLLLMIGGFMQWMKLRGAAAAKPAA